MRACSAVPKAEFCVGYYNYFPPKSTGVEIRTEDTPEGPRKYVAVIKDFKKGDLIYKARVIC